ncbi:MAG: response regulator [Alphaproteobacteria bacterium]
MKDYDLSRLNLLLVDDNKHILSVLRTALNGLGVQSIQEANDGAEAFDVLKRFAADIVIVDYLMSPIDGLTFTQMTRTARDSPDPSVPIIMLTANTAIRQVREARDAGVTEFLAKPITVRALYERLLAIIEEPRPFIRCSTYIGPDRRRRHDPAYTGPDRRFGQEGDVGNVKRTEHLKERLTRRETARSWRRVS